MVGSGRGVPGLHEAGLRQQRRPQRARRNACPHGTQLVAMADEPQDMAVLFADVCGSPRLYESFGDTEALATIGRCVALISDVCVGHGGRVVKTIGDEAMAVFPSADKAANAAAEMQARMSAPAPVAGVRPR